MMEIRPIRTEDDYDAALAEIERLMGATAGTPEGGRLEVLVTLVEAYEDQQYSLVFSVKERSMILRGASPILFALCGVSRNLD